MEFSSFIASFEEKLPRKIQIFKAMVGRFFHYYYFLIIGIFQNSVIASELKQAIFINGRQFLTILWTIELLLYFDQLFSFNLQNEINHAPIINKLIIFLKMCFVQKMVQ